MELSVIIPAYNRREALRRCLLSLNQQDYPKDKFEVLIIDDAASSATREMIGRLLEKNINARYFQQKHLGPAAARNLGVEAAKGSIIGFTDDDCELDRGWVKLMVAAHQKNPKIAAVGGLTGIPHKRQRIMVGQFLSNGAIQVMIDGKKEVIFLPTCNVSFKRKILTRYKFHEKFPLPGGEDLELFWRLFKNGYRFIWSKEIRAVHYRDNSLNSFIKQAYAYGRGNLLTKFLHQEHPLLKELNTGTIYFWWATSVNIVKIPWFSFFLANRLIQQEQIKGLFEKFSVYGNFTLHKIFYIIGNICELFRIKTIRPPLVSKPRLLILDITHRCNLSCQICDIWKTGKDEKELSLNYVKKALSQAQGQNIPEIVLSGGEPLLRKDIFEIFNFAQKIKIKNLGVLTNGILLNKLEKRIEPFILDNTISLVISLDSLKPQVHDQIRNLEGAWQKTVNSLDKLSLLKKRFNQVNFNVITIILQQNLEEILNLASFIKELGANSLQFQPLLANNLRMDQRKSSLFGISQDRLALLDETIDKIIEFKTSHHDFVRNSVENLCLFKKYYRGSINSGDVQCHSAGNTVLVANSGFYTTCFGSYGNIKSQSLRSILQGEHRIKAIKKVQQCAWPCLLPCFCDSEAEGVKIV